MSWKDIIKNEDFGYWLNEETGEPIRNFDYGGSLNKKFKPKCQNGPCLRIANGTDGIGFCMPCEDDASDNRLTDPKSPYTRENQMKNPTLPNIFVGDEK